MNNIGRYKPPAEPEREIVESAIAKLLEIAECQGITAVDLIQMLDSGMRISDFLNALDILKQLPAIPSIAIPSIRVLVFPSTAILLRLSG